MRQLITLRPGRVVEIRVLAGHFGELVEDNPDFCMLIRAEGIRSSNIPQ